MSKQQLCSVEGCKRAYFGKGYCAAHYRRVIRLGDPRPQKPIKQRGITEQCKIEGCDRGSRAKGLCFKHYQQIRNGKTPTLGNERNVGKGGARRIYPDSPTVPFCVRVRNAVASEISALAKARGESEVTIKRMIVSAGIEVLEAQQEAQP